MVVPLMTMFLSVVLLVLFIMLIAVAVVVGGDRGGRSPGELRPESSPSRQQ